jgi:isopenicillin N synthase-like dioxygenase
MVSHGPSSFTIPTIDLSAYLQHPESSDADTVVEQIRTPCATSGFFQLVGHGVPEPLQQQAFAAARTFFNLSDEEKRKLSSKPGRGYELIGTQFLEDGKQPDLKEVSFGGTCSMLAVSGPPTSATVRELNPDKFIQGFFIGREVAGVKPPFRPFQDPNIWPSQDLIPNSHFKAPLLKYHQALSDLSFMIMRILASGMKDFDTSVFAEFCQEPIASIRLLHYPPHPDIEDTTLVGTGAHTYFGAITLLLQDGNSGLQVLDQETNGWVDVAPRQDAYVVNVGDMLDVWTGGVYKSTIHRVINTSGAERYSIPFFLDGNPDCTIKALDNSAGNGKGKTFTVEEHMLSRYAASYK